MRYGMGMGAATAALLLCASAGSADVLEFNIDTVFSSFQADGYVNVKFEDVVGGVKLTITSHLAPAVAPPTDEAEWLKDLYLNFDDSKTVGSLQFALQGTTGAFAAPAISKGLDAFGADGDGLYDIKFLFAEDLADRFNLVDSAEYLITSTESIDVSSFFFKSTHRGGAGTWYAAGHIGSIGLDDESGWHGATLVPLPTPVYLGLAGLALAAGVSAVKRRR